MSRIPALPAAQLPAASRPLLDVASEAYGRIPRMLQVLALAPAALAGYLQLSQQLAAGVLRASERERVALAVSQYNGCDYCLRAHAWLGRLHGLDAQAAEQARAALAGDPLAHFARRLQETRGQLSDEDFCAAVTAGLTPERMLEVVAHVALQTFSNYLNNLAQTAIDFPA